MKIALEISFSRVVTRCEGGMKDLFSSTSIFCDNDIVNCISSLELGRIRTFKLAVVQSNQRQRKANERCSRHSAASFCKSCRKSKITFISLKNSSSVLHSLQLNSGCGVLTTVHTC